MYEYDEIILNTFLSHQDQLFSEPVAFTLEGADEFLSEYMAQVVQNEDEVLEYFEEAGIDTEGMTREQILDSCEVFEIPDGRYLIIEA